MPGKDLMMKHSHACALIFKCIMGWHFFHLTKGVIMQTAAKRFPDIMQCRHRNAEFTDTKSCSDRQNPALSGNEQRIDTERQRVTPSGYLPHASARLAPCFNVSGDRLSFRNELRNNPQNICYIPPLV
jgi:hypothetical protein